MREYCEKSKQNCFDIVPLTFHVEGGKEEFEAIHEKEKEMNHEGIKTMWIVKPGERSNRGCGINIFRKVQEV